MAAEPNIGAVKIFGYLEKKGKMKVVTTWKKYWFVLEGRLLLYYRSREEYENLSPCKGSINMGLAINIRPGLATAGVLEIITRTNTITLRAKQRSIQEKWLQALMDASGQQPSVSSPVKMTHFRYSMDNLIPPQTKAAHKLTRQNTLPHRFNTTASKFPENKPIVTRLQRMGARSYGGSLDSIVKKTKHKPMDGKANAEGDTNAPETPDEQYERNELYGRSGEFVDNAEYVTTHDEKSDCNKNLLIENEEYLKCGEVEYYCTYEEINNGVYYEPDLPPRPPDDARTATERRPSDSEDGDVKKMSAFSKIARKFRNFKTNKKKKNDDEPIYTEVNYFEVNEVKTTATDDDHIVKTLLDLKQALEEKKLKVKDILESSSSKTDETNEIKEDPTFTSSEEDSSDGPEVKQRPGLPPRTGTKTHNRSPSPYHDTPMNNSPVNPIPTPDIDKILNDLEQEQNEELNVRQLIKKFNKTEGETSADVSLRQKHNQGTSDDETSSIVNRYSEDLNKLLEELTKVTSAPLLTPGVTSSLIQMKSPPVTDEEWLALTPIRRRRFSDPDYDVPRPHRSLQILAETTDDKTDTDEAIPATRFFGPVLETWRSMTPDSLEPVHGRKQPNDGRACANADCSMYMDSLEPLSEGATAF